ncbi:MAG TPA: PspC domain-containing protein, partial [Thermomonospora sp.]|nr:PspC domain-containing protein [Thermomonospora sp.]
MAGQDTVTGMRRLERPREGRILAGVCVGLGRYTRVDPVVLRVGFAVLTLAGGPGILVYLAAYLLIPGDAGQAAALERALRRRFDADTVLVLLGGLMGATTVLITMVGGLSEDALAAVTVLALVLLVAHARKVDFGAVARGLPEGLRGHPLRPDPPPPPGEAPVFLDDLDAGDAVRRAAPLPEGMVDLATLSEPEPAPPAEPARRPARKRSPVTSVTLLGALAGGAAMIR